MQLPVIKQLKEELAKLERELRVDIPRELNEAAAHGDLSENAEYSAAKERQSFLEARIAQLIERIHSLSSLKLDALPRDRVAFGTKVFLTDIDTEEEVSYELVTPEEVDPGKGKISINSPVGKGLMGKTEGDEVIILLPAGKKEYEVTRVITIHEMVEG